MWPQCNGWWYQNEHKEYHLSVASVNQTEAQQTCETLDATLAVLTAADVEFLTALIDSNDTAFVEGCVPRFDMNLSNTNTLRRRTEDH